MPLQVVPQDLEPESLFNIQGEFGRTIWLCLPAARTARSVLIDDGVDGAMNGDGFDGRPAGARAAAAGVAIPDVGQSVLLQAAAESARKAECTRTRLQGRPERSVPVRQRQKIQKVLPQPLKCRH
jgi:hypothetical protein